MPWKESRIMDQRSRFVLAVRHDGASVAHACREFGISRPTAYKWLRRYDAHGVEALADRSRAPKSSPTKTDPHIENLILAARRSQGWGAKKLVAWLGMRHPQLQMPAPSTAHDILVRHGMVQPRGRRRAAAAGPDTGPGPLAAADGPNKLWSVDHKGRFALGDGSMCYPLTITDNHSRMILCCDALASTGAELARASMERAFERWGLPEAIRSDNGAPFASGGVLGISWLSAWWCQLGIEHQRCQPASPQQNGRHERMHRTLKQACARPGARTLEGQQARFDAWVPHFNNERPHEALGQVPPVQVHRRSERELGELEPLRYPMCDLPKRVSAKGELHLGYGRLFVGEALRGQHVGLVQLEGGVWLVKFGRHELGVFEVGDRSLSAVEKGKIEKTFSV